jgi:hypothetical protein
MSRDPFLVRALLACHPRSWRQRYGEEFAAVLTDSLGPGRWVHRPSIVLDVLRGAVHARLNPNGGVLVSTRSPMSMAVWAAGLFTVAGVGFQKLTEDQALSTAAGRHAGTGWAFDTLLIAAAIALGALMVAALPTAVALARGGSNGTLWLLAVPPLAIAAWFGVLRIAFLIGRGHSVHSAPNLVAAVLVVGSGVAVVAAIAWAATVVLRRVPAPGGARLRAVTLAAVAAGMAVSTAACLVWGLFLRAADPAGFAARDGILATPLLPSWILTLVLMATATGLAANASRGQPLRQPAPTT